MTIDADPSGSFGARSLAIVGASARAAAMSACRAGFLPTAIDLFADADLRLVASCRQCESYPRQLPVLLAQSPPGPWIYTGALENHPDLIAQMAAARPLWGNGPETLRAVRRPESLFTALRAGGFCCPDWSCDAKSVPRDGSWLRKTFRSGGGDGVSTVNDKASDNTPAMEAETPSDDEVYYQRYVAGMPCSAVYVGAGNSAVLAGVTRQLIGLSWAGADGFRYCGSLGPLLLSAPVLAEFVRLGSFLAKQFGLTGLFGVDAVLASVRTAVEPFNPAACEPSLESLEAPPTARIWPIEVNPRYTASVEVLERALGWRALADHARACATCCLPEITNTAHQGAVPVCGKLIVFATRDLDIGESLPQRLLRDNSKLIGRDGAAAWPRWADIPVAFSRIRRGWPVLTALAIGASARETAAQLRSDAKALQQQLSESAVAGAL